MLNEPDLPNEPVLASRVRIKVVMLIPGSSFTANGRNFERHYWLTKSDVEDDEIELFPGILGFLHADGNLSCDLIVRLAVIGVGHTHRHRRVQLRLNEHQYPLALDASVNFGFFPFVAVLLADPYFTGEKPRWDWSIVERERRGVRMPSRFNSATI